MYIYINIPVLIINQTDKDAECCREWREIRAIYGLWPIYNRAPSKCDALRRRKDI